MLCGTYVETTSLSVYHQEPMEVGYVILRVTPNGKKSLKFQRLGSTVSQLTMTDVDSSPEAVGNTTYCMLQNSLQHFMRQSFAAFNIEI